MILFFYNLACSLPSWSARRGGCGRWPRPTSIAPAWESEVASAGGSRRAGRRSRRPQPPDYLAPCRFCGRSAGRKPPGERTRSAFPQFRLLVSTTTRTGQDLARQRLGDDRVFYCPLDVPWAVRACLNSLKPRILILAETEFWPNILSRLLSPQDSGRGGQCSCLRSLMASLPPPAVALAADPEPAFKSACAK